MKKTTTLVALMMLAATPYAGAKDRAYFAMPASHTRANTATAERNYLVCLGTENDGVVESALAHVAMMKLAVPGNDYRLLGLRVDAVTRTAASPEIRYKAFLVGTVLTNPEMFESVARESYDSPDELFGAIASRLSEYHEAR